jgi:ferredoxin-type protein NapH
MALTSRQIARNIVWWVIFFVILIGIPVGYFGFYSVGTVCWSDPFFHMQSVVIHGFNQSLWGYFTINNAVSLLGFSLIALIVFTLIFGRAFCSWICPFGAMLDFTGKLSNLMGTERKELPEVIKDRNIKYGVLIGFLAIGAFLGRAVFCDFCPLGTFYRTTGPYAYSFPWLVLFPVSILFGFLFIAYFYKPRAWCMYICPLGAFIAAEDKASMIRVQLPSDSCIECKQCEKTCPMDIPLMKETRYKLLHDPKVKSVLHNLDQPDLLKKPTKFEKLPEEVQAVLTERGRLYKVPPGECIRCYQCVDVCPIVRKAKEKVKEEKKAAKLEKLGIAQPQENT